MTVPLKMRTGVELARTGEWNTSTGKWNCTRAQIADAVRAGQSGKFRNGIIKRGHVDPRFAGDAVIAEDGEPALGQVRNLRAADDGDTLIGDVLVPDWLDDELDAIYPSRSVEADLGVETPDGDSFAMVLTGLALLGVTKPAIPSLAELPERIAASEYTAAFSVAAGFFDEAAHPRGGKGSAAGGKFVAKGDGYKGKKDGQGQGKEADDVREVQSELIRLGLLSKDSGKNGGNDGLFGPKTEAAVKKWQKAHGHAETGKVSPALLAALKKATKADPEKPGKSAGTKAPARKAPQLMRGNRAKKVNAAAAAAAPEGLDIREITADTVVYDDADGRVWAAAWDDVDDEITVYEAAPAVARYETIAASAAGVAAHNLLVPLYSGRGWDAQHITASLGDTSVSIAPAVREALGMSETDTEEAVEAALLARLQAPEAPIAQENPTGDTPAIPVATENPNPITSEPELVQVPVVSGEVTKLAASLAEVRASQATSEKLIASLSTELAERKAREASDHKTRIFASALADGKISPAQKVDWETSYDESPAAIERVLAALAPGTAFPVTASGYAGDPETVPSDDDKAFAAIMGWDK